MFVLYHVLSSSLGLSGSGIVVLVVFVLYHVLSSSHS